MKQESAKYLKRVLLGTAVGDSLGLPAEGLSRKRIARRWKGDWEQRLVFGYGMVSDDTEHTVFVAKSLIQAGGDIDLFKRCLARRLRWWLVGGPPGVGLATARSIVKLWLGFSADKSGVYSAGNGPSMRSAIIGVYLVGNEPSIRQFVAASTRITHTDPKAEIAALAVALTASRITQRHGGLLDIDDLIALWKSCGGGEWISIVDCIEESFKSGASVDEFAHHMGLGKGVSGYSYHSVPVALYAWLRHQGDFEKSLSTVLDCGGDTDSTAAVCGALAALQSPVPDRWRDRIYDWPISIPYLIRLSEQLACGSNLTLDWRWWFYPLRNLLFLGIIVIHVLRRLLPI